MAEILIVDDDENMCSAFRHLLETDGHTPIIAGNAEDAVESVKRDRPDIVFMDVRMPGMDGLETLKQIRELDPNVYVIVMTAYSTSQTSIEAVRLGAFDYLNKPLDLDDVRHAIDKALAAQTLSRRAAARQTPAWGQYSLVNLVGGSPRMQEIYKLIGLLTTNDVPALILGERGVGKHLVARTIHFNSSRKDRPFATVNCQVAPPETMELEIFGRKAMVGSPAYVGRIAQANGGTLFIDGIQYLPRVCQNKLLRYLKEKVYEQTGGAEALTADTRIIAASTQGLADPVKQGLSVELYDALRLITIDLPRLRERREDIPELVDLFIRRHNSELQKNIKGIDDPALDLLRDYGWPGNVAELESAVKRACILSRGDVIAVDEARDALQVGAPPTSEEVQGALEAAVREALQRALPDAELHGDSVFYTIVTQVETALVREALRLTGGNQVKAAEVLGLNRTTLRKKIDPEAS